jgi:hypothetical protein
MNTPLRIAALAGLLLASAGCAHRQPKSSFRIIEEGDRNPMITEAPQRAGERVRRDDGPR